MRYKFTLPITLILFASLTLTACGSASTATTGGAAATAAPAAGVATAALAPTAAPTAVSESTAAPTAMPESTAAPTVMSEPTTAATSAAAGKIAILLPETKTARYESQDLPNFKAKLTALGFDVATNLIYSNANQDASAQQQQAEAALTNGAKVLVLDPVDSDSAAVIADAAKAKGVPVIAYDRLIKGSDGVGYYISFDNEQVGKLQAQSLLEALKGKADPTVVMINGSPTDNNATLFKQGAQSVFDPLVAQKKLTIAKEYDTPDWSPDQAQNEMTQALTALSNKVDGVYAANDGTGGGVIAAMKAAGVKPLPPVTGQDAELAAIQRILTGEQYMTVYKAIKPEAEAAADLAYTLLQGKQPDTSKVNGKVANGKIDVPSILLTPVAVTKSNIEDTIIADGFWKASDICTSDYAAACTAAGIK
jgi:D-xylose transport system substrate-binding protein